jgi:hypothetical protein
MKKIKQLTILFLLVFYSCPYLLSAQTKVCYIWVKDHWERPKANVKYPSDSLHCFDNGKTPSGSPGGVSVSTIKGGKHITSANRNENAAPDLGNLQLPGVPENLDINFVGDYPRNRNFSWSENTQGIANDDANWYISQSGTLWKIPMGLNLNQSVSAQTASVKTTLIPNELKGQNFNHFGDIDYANGKLFVPLEAGDLTFDGKIPCKIAIFNAANLTYLASADLLLPESTSAKQTHAPWCAIDPVTNILWTSNDNNVDELYGYNWKIVDSKVDIAQLELTYNSTKKLGVTLNKVQGGAFSKKSGLFYMVSNTTDKETGGLLSWHWNTGTYLGNFPIRFKPGFPSLEELEGITVSDTQIHPSTGVKGQVHIVMIENKTFNDNVWLKHFEINVEK